jgi:hypothetical protein
MADYLHAHPGIKDTIHGKIYTIKWLYSKKSDAEKFISKLRKDNMYKEIILHPRIIDGKLFGKHPWMIAVRGRIYAR